MPTISVFYGIIVRMYSEPNSPHKLPHLHAEYQGKQAVYDFEGNVLEGNLPSNKHKLLEAWILIHKEDLEANWQLLQEGSEFFKINPLQ